MADKILAPPDPYLKYPGGKRKLVPAIAQYFDRYRDRRFVDLFCGSTAVTLGLRPAEALLNDINPHVINLHRWVQRGWGVGCRVDAVEVAFLNDEDVYYVNRETFNDCTRKGQHETLESAMLFYYLNRTCFNGLVRFSQKGNFNAPFGHYKAVPYLKNFQAWKAAFFGWEFSNQDFATVVLRPDDFVYADPPYDSVEDSESEQLSFLGHEFVGATGQGFVGYSGAFTWHDQVRLARWLAKHPGPVLISNAATPRIVALYSGLGFVIKTIQVRWSISCSGDRPIVDEILAFKEAHNAS